jgi:hypothetical protein
MQLASHNYAVQMRLNDKALATKFQNAQSFSPSEDVAQYIIGLLPSLTQMARGAELTTLAYLLDMARLEAESVIER